MNKKITVSIGIPAYNEDANIRKLLLSVLSQKEMGFRVLEIIVVSDGSTDRTEDEVRKINSKKIKFSALSQRIGKSARINQIFDKFRGDILLLIDADIIINDINLIKKILDKSDFEKSGLVSISAIPYASTHRFSKIIRIGNLLTYEIGKKWKKGNNYLLFKGCFLGLSKNFAKSVKIPEEIINNDAYLYLKAKSQNFSPRFIAGPTVYFQLPQNISDHLKQSFRFKISKNEMKKYFKSDFDLEYKVPRSVYLPSLFKVFFKAPFYFMCYVILNIISRLRRSDDTSSSWDIAESTKKYEK